VSVAQNSKLLAWVRYHAQTFKFSSHSRLSERPCRSKPLLGRLGETHESELNVRLYNSRLGEVDPLGRDWQGFESDHASTLPKPYQNTN